MTSTIDPADDVSEDGPPADSPHSPIPAALGIAVATALLLAAIAGIVFVFVFVFVHRAPTEPAPVAQQVPAAPAPSATPTPAEQFLDTWRQLAPGVAARRSDETWTQIGISTCNLIGIPGATPDVISRVLGSNPDLMSVTEGTEFLGVANAKLCPEKGYVAGPTLVMPDLVIPAVPDLHGLPVPHLTVPSIPTVHVSPPKIIVPSIPSGGHRGGAGGSSSSDGGSSSGGSSGGSQPPSIIRPPDVGGPVHPQG